MSGGVFAGASSASQNVDSPSGKPASPRVGTSGSAATRLLVLTASGFTLPSLTGPMLDTAGTKAYWMRPAIVSARIGGVPLSGTCSAFTPAATLNFSMLTCAPLPTPAVA